MKHILFVQGGGDGAYAVDARLAASLGRDLGPDYQVRFPRMPNEGSPDYESWKRKLAEELATLGDGVILVGHSIGATILVNALAEAQPRHSIAGIFLVAAPFVGEGGWPSDEMDPPKDLGARLPPDVPVYLYQGREDDTVPLGHVDLYARAIPQAVIRRLDGRDHQLNDDLSEVARDIERLG